MNEHNEAVKAGPKPNPNQEDINHQVITLDIRDLPTEYIQEVRKELVLAHIAYYRYDSTTPEGIQKEFREKVRNDPTLTVADKADILGSMKVVTATNTKNGHQSIILESKDGYHIRNAGTDPIKDPGGDLVFADGIEMVQQGKPATQIRDLEKSMDDAYKTGKMSSHKPKDNGGHSLGGNIAYHAVDPKGSPLRKITFNSAGTLSIFGPTSGALLPKNPRHTHIQNPNGFDLVNQMGDLPASLVINVSGDHGHGPTSLFGHDIKSALDNTADLLSSRKITDLHPNSRTRTQDLRELTAANLWEVNESRAHSISNIEHAAIEKEITRLEKQQHNLNTQQALIEKTVQSMVNKPLTSVMPQGFVPSKENLALYPPVMHTQILAYFKVINRYNKARVDGDKVAQAVALHEMECMVEKELLKAGTISLPTMESCQSGYVHDNTIIHNVVARNRASEIQDMSENERKELRSSTLSKIERNRRKIISLEQASAHDPEMKKALEDAIDRDKKLLAVIPTPKMGVGDLDAAKKLAKIDNDKTLSDEHKKAKKDQLKDDLKADIQRRDQQITEMPHQPHITQEMMDAHKEYNDLQKELYNGMGGADAPRPSNSNRPKAPVLSQETPKQDMPVGDLPRSKERAAIDANKNMTPEHKRARKEQLYRDLQDAIQREERKIDSMRRDPSVTPEIIEGKQAYVDSQKRLRDDLKTHAIMQPTAPSKTSQQNKNSQQAADQFKQNVINPLDTQIRALSQNGRKITINGKNVVDVLKDTRKRAEIVYKKIQAGTATEKEMTTFDRIGGRQPNRPTTSRTPARRLASTPPRRGRTHSNNGLTASPSRHFVYRNSENHSNPKGKEMHGHSLGGSLSKKNLQHRAFPKRDDYVKAPKPIIIQQSQRAIAKTNRPHVTNEHRQAVRKHVINKVNKQIEQYDQIIHKMKSGYHIPEKLEMLRQQRDAAVKYRDHLVKKNDRSSYQHRHKTSYNHDHDPVYGGSNNYEERNTDIGNDNSDISSSSSDSGSNYTIQGGDTLSEIAEDHGTTVEQLMEDNDIKDPDKIYEGDDLYIRDNDDSSIRSYQESDVFQQWIPSLKSSLYDVQQWLPQKRSPATKPRDNVPFIGMIFDNKSTIIAMLYTAYQQMEPQQIRPLNKQSAISFDVGMLHHPRSGRFILPSSLAFNPGPAATIFPTKDNSAAAVTAAAAPTPTLTPPLNVRNDAVPALTPSLLYKQKRG